MHVTKGYPILACGIPAAVDSALWGISTRDAPTASDFRPILRLSHARDMRAGTETALARVVADFGAARPHHAYLFANRRANRMKVLVQDGIGVWLAARRLNSGKFVWQHGTESTNTLSRAQFEALVLGLPWKNVGEAGIITVL